MGLSREHVALRDDVHGTTLTAADRWVWGCLHAVTRVPPE
jgi:hypothetical protein